MLSKAILEERRKYVCSSDIGIIMGLAPEGWPTIEDLWYDKKGVTKEFQGNVDTERGNFLEPMVAKMFTKLTGADCEKARGMDTFKKYPHLAANIDYWTNYNGLACILELKCPRMKTIQKYQAEGIPKHYICQIQLQMMVANCKQAIMFAFNFENMEDCLIHVEEDPEIQNIIAEEAQRFHKTLELDEYPRELLEGPKEEPDFSMYCTKEEVDFTKSETLTVHINDWLDAEDQIDFYSLEKAKAKEAIESILGEHKSITCGDIRIKRNIRKGSKRFNKSKFLLEHPEIELDRYYEVGKPSTNITKSIIKGATPNATINSRSA